MMSNFHYRYRKSAFLWRFIFGLVYVGFILFWMRMAWSMMGNFSHIGNDTSTGIFTPMRGMFTIIPLILLAVGLYITFTSLFKVLSTSAVIAGDDQGLTIKGTWFKKYHFAWSDLEYVRYEQQTRFYQNTNNMATGSYLQEYLMVKPKVGRTVSVNISQLDGAVDDILSDIRRIAPILEIKGFSQ